MLVVLPQAFSLTVSRECEKTIWSTVPATVPDAAQTTVGVSALITGTSPVRPDAGEVTPTVELCLQPEQGSDRPLGDTPVTTPDVVLLAARSYGQLIDAG